MKKQATCVVGFCLLFSLIGCAADRPGEEEPAGEAPEDVVDQLRSLPYLDYSSGKADDGRSGVVRLDRGRSYPGYTLYSNRNLCSAELVDAEGRLVHSWQGAPCHHWVNCELSTDGDLFLTGMDAIEEDERRPWFDAHFVQRLSWNGDVVWKRQLPAHHDTEVTPRGQLLTLTMKFRDLPAVHPTVEVRDNLLTLMTLEGRVLEELSLYDLFTSAADSTDFELKKVRVAHMHGADEIDLFHANSVEWMRRPRLADENPIYGLSNVLISIRHQDAIAMIDWDEQRVVWAWGQGEISGPHDATVLDDGNIMLFDNGLSRRWSRVLELDPATGEILWEYKAEPPEDFFTASRGANQRLPNGNTLITNSDSGQLFEVTREGEIVWEFLNPHFNAEGHRATIVRSKRYETSLIDHFMERFATN